VVFFKSLTKTQACKPSPSLCAREGEKERWWKTQRSEKQADCYVFTRSGSSPCSHCSRHHAENTVVLI